jgi:hypothetical protein
MTPHERKIPWRFRRCIECGSTLLRTVSWYNRSYFKKSGEKVPAHEIKFWEEKKFRTFRFKRIYRQCQVCGEELIDRWCLVKNEEYDRFYRELYGLEKKKIEKKRGAGLKE